MRKTGEHIVWHLKAKLKMELLFVKANNIKDVQNIIHLAYVITSYHVRSYFQRGEHCFEFS